MTADIDISRELLGQFASRLGVGATGSALSVDSPIGTGNIRKKSFPNGLEVYFFDFQLRQAFEMRSANPLDSEWLLININLSARQVEKQVNNQEISLQRNLPTGMLLYTPKTEVYSVSPPDTPFSIVLIRFHRSFLQSYPQLEAIAREAAASLVYEDLDFRSESLLKKCLPTNVSPLVMHGHVLEFLGIFFDKLQRRETGEVDASIHPADLKGLFAASALLRNPFEAGQPSVEELARIAGMGTTKFNAAFKQVFGTSPMKYNLKIRLEYARDKLEQKSQTPSEVSYALGYSHPSKFTQAFKKHFGLLPSEV